MREWENVRPKSEGESGMDSNAMLRQTATQTGGTQRRSLQFGGFSLGLLQDGDVGVSVLPER